MLEVGRVCSETRLKRGLTGANLYLTYAKERQHEMTLKTFIELRIYGIISLIR